MKKLAAISLLILAVVLVYLSTSQDKVLDEYQGHTANQIIEKMEASEENFDLELASIKYDTLDITENNGQQKQIVIEEDFYLSIAPYETFSHDCYYHSLTTCQGELVNESVYVKIEDENGTVLVDENTKTNPNGFVGFWLERDLEDLTVTITAGDKSASAMVSTGTEDLTCLTTMRLI